MPYNATLDLLRFLAFLSVAWIHTPEPGELERWTLLGRWAVPFFAAASAYFAADLAIRRPAQRIAQYAVDRSLRIYLVFLVWTGVYFLVRILGHVAVGANDPRDLVGLAMLLTGTAPHLWFLPFVAGVTLAAFAAARLAARAEMSPLVGAAAALAGVCLAVMPGGSGGGTWFFEVTRDALPAALLGLGMRMLSPRREARPAAAGLGFITAAGVCVASLALLVQGGERVVLVETVAGVAAFAAALAGPSLVSSRWSRQLGEATFGLFAAHFLPVAVSQIALHQAGLPSAGVRAALVFVSAVATSFVLCGVGMSLPATRLIFVLRRTSGGGALIPSRVGVRRS